MARCASRLIFSCLLFANFDHTFNSITRYLAKFYRMIFRLQKQDSLCKLFEMDNHKDRPAFIEGLLAFMQERGTPIVLCPTISKNPLDLFRLFNYVDAEGGFLEVCKVRPGLPSVLKLSCAYIVD